MYMRNSVKAFIVKEEKLLTIKGIDDRGDFYLLPGGGQRPGETMIQALQRECREEINCQVEVGDIQLGMYLTTIRLILPGWN